MDNATVKHRLFVSEPMGDKEVDELPGVGRILRRKLEQNGYAQAHKLLGQFLTMEKNTEAFTDWLRSIGAKANHANLCADCLKEWCDNNL